MGQRNKRVFLGKILDQEETLSNYNNKYSKYCPKCQSNNPFISVLYEPKRGFNTIQTIDECEVCGYILNGEDKKEGWNYLSLDEKNHIIQTIPGVPKEGTWHLKLCDSIELAVKNKNNQNN